MSRVRVSSSAPRKARTVPAVRALVLSHAGPTAPSSAYRATGADLFVEARCPPTAWPWRATSGGSPTRRPTRRDRAHRVNRGPGGSWATVGLAGHPNGFLRTVAHPEAFADPDQARRARRRRIPRRRARTQVDLGPGARLDVNVDDPVLAAPAARGLQRVPGRPGTQPVLAPMAAGRDGPRHRDARRRGVGPRRRLGLRREELGQGRLPRLVVVGPGPGVRGARGLRGVRRRLVHAGPLRTTVTAVVVLLPDGTLVRLGNPGTSPVRAQVTDEDWVLRGRSAAGSWRSRALAAGRRARAARAAARRETQHPGRDRAPRRVDAGDGRRRGRLVWRGESSLAALEHGGVDRAGPRWPGAVTAPVRRTPRQ